MKLAIKGHPKRGKEVIETLEMLGGINKFNLDGAETNRYYYIEDSKIYFCLSLNPQNCIGYTLEEFLEKFLYKIGDKVSSKYLKNYEVSKMEWESVNNRVIYKLQGMGWYSADELQPYKEETMKDYLVTEEDYGKTKTLDKLIEPKEETMEGTIKIDIPKGYEFFGIDDDNKVVLTKKQPQYPKTYGECCKELGHPAVIMSDYVLGYKGSLLNSLQKLLICLDAYWKIAGEQMGWGKAWEPDWNEETDKFTISNKCNKIYLNNTAWYAEVLSFPTAEMRNAFYENFKDLIEKCKKLL